MSNGHSAKSWWSEHFLDLIVVLLTVIGLWIAYQIPHSIDTQDSAERLRSERNSRAEEDRAQAVQIASGALGEESSDHVESKRSAARAIWEFAQLGGVYAPSTTLLLHYLSRETDVQTHCYLQAAVNRGINTRPPNVGKKSGNPDDNEVLEESGWKKDQTAQLETLRELTKSTDDAQCFPPLPVQPTIPPIEVSAPPPSEFRQYLDVDCERNNQGSVRFPIDSGLSTKFKVASATTFFENVSNVKQQQASVVSTDPAGATIQYNIVGLDRQFLGNCPGGGHATLVVRFQLEPK